MTALHLGHGPFLPANFSLTSNRALQPGQRTEIGIEENSARMRPRLVPCALVWHSRAENQATQDGYRSRERGTLRVGDPMRYHPLCLRAALYPTPLSITIKVCPSPFDVRMA